MLNIPCALEKKYVFFYHWVDCFLNVNYIKLVNSVGQIFYILDDFLSTYYLNGLERNIEVSKYNCRFVYFPSQFYHFLLHVFCSLYIVKCIHILQCYISWWIVPFIIIKCFSFSSKIFLVPKSASLDINISSSSFLLIDVWMVYIFPFFYFYLIYIDIFRVDFLQTTYSWVFSFNLTG